MVAWLSKVSSQVSPSGRAFATASAPIEPAAPERFSTTTVAPRRCVSPGVTSRATASVDPPGAKGTMMRMDWPWARAMPGAASATAAAASAERRVRCVMTFSSRAGLGWALRTRHAPGTGYA